MLAVQLDEFGPPDVLGTIDRPDPVPGPGEVMIAVEVAAVTFVETQMRAGRGPFTIEAPWTPGNGVGGRIVATGDGVDRALIGSRVVSTTGGSGGYAERVVVAADSVIPVPDDLAIDEAVALLADGRTALALVDAVDIQPGAIVLIEAAAGGVGTLLVQLAKRAGAGVVAAVGGPHKVGVAADLGADVTVDYLAPGWTDAVRDAVGNVDVVFDGVGGAIAADAFELVGRGGTMISFGGASGRFGGIDAADAHRAIEARATIGKTLLEVAPLT